MKNKINILFYVSFCAFILNIAILPATVFSQGAEPDQTQGGAGSTIQVDRTPFLSFIKIPASFALADQNTATTAAQVFSDPVQTTLPASRALIVSDNRNSGGFNLQASSNGNFVIAGQGETPNIPSVGLRIVTTTNISPIPGAPTPDIIDGIIYLGGYSGLPVGSATKNVIAPLNIAFNEPEGCDNFGSYNTFIKSACRTVQGGSNALNNTVDLMQGCLPSTGGRTGKMQVGVAYNLAVPAYTPPGTYSNTITFTLSDSTDNCQP